jgi:hypothetical protein
MFDASVKAVKAPPGSSEGSKSDSQMDLECPHILMVFGKMSMGQSVHDELIL